MNFQKFEDFKIFHIERLTKLKNKIRLEKEFIKINLELEQLLTNLQTPELALDTVDNFRNIL